MGEAQPPGPQGQGLAVSGPAVFPVPYQGEAPPGELHPDLLGAAGVQPGMAIYTLYALALAVVVIPVAAIIKMAVGR